MKNTIKLLMLSFLVTFCVTGCNDDDTYMKSEIVDMNSRITAIDKAATQPGETVTFSGAGLDKVYHIMLNRENVPVEFEVNEAGTELYMMIPSQTPLGDAVTVNLFFSGKGLAQRVLKIFSPPQIDVISPVAARPGTVLRVMGRELYLTRSARLGGIDASFELVDDKNLNIVVPAGFTGGDLVLVTETGSETVSSNEVILGTEILVTNVDENGPVLASWGAYSNASSTNGDEGFPRFGVGVITIEDNGSSWGANCDFSLQNMPADVDGVPIDLTRVEMVADIKASKNLSINFMIGKAHNPPGLWGKMVDLNGNWTTIVVPFTELGQGYSNDPISDDPLIPFEEYLYMKWSLPAQSSAGNFGATITFDNVKFIIRD